MMEIISRKEAIEKGLKRYFTGKPCKYGHVSERNISGQCVSCEKDKHREINKSVSRKKYKKNFNEEYYKENKEYYQNYMKEYYQQNKEHIRDYYNTRYAVDKDYKTSRVCRRILEKTLKATSSTKDSRTYKMLGYCNEQLKDSISSKFLEGMSWDNYGDWHIDHIYPVTRYIKDGVEDPSIINSLDNLIPMYAEHNLEKSDRTLEEYLDDRKDLVELYGRFL